MSAWVWGSLTLAVFLNEMYALAFRTDAYQPLTYYVRKLIRRPGIWFLVFSFWVWLGIHFFIQKG